MDVCVWRGVGGKDDAGMFGYVRVCSGMCGYVQCTLWVLKPPPRLANAAEGMGLEGMGLEGMGFEGLLA